MPKPKFSPKLIVVLLFAIVVALTIGWICTPLFAQTAQSSTNILSAPWSDRKPYNLQCPVCGTMASKYHPDRRYCGDYSSLPGGVLNGCDPMQTIVRCKRCNAAFWVDAGEVK